MVALAVAALGFFWFAVAPHVVVRHWDGDFGVTCRQLLNGRAQWNDPREGVWVNDSGSGPSRC
jgi:hypothetical protein